MEKHHPGTQGIFCRAFFFLARSRNTEEIWNHYTSSHLQKGKKGRVFSSPNRKNNQIRFQDWVSFPEGGKINKRCCCQGEKPSLNSWKVTRRHMGRTWASSQFAGPAAWLCAGIKVGDTWKIKAKSKHVSGLRGNQAWYCLGKEAHAG